MTNEELLKYASGFAMFFGLVPYYVSIRKGKNPALVSWIIWSLLDILTFSGMWVDKSENLLQVGVAMLGGMLVLALVFHRGEFKWTWSDTTFLGLGFLGILLWWWFDEPLLGIITGVGVVMLGGIPTVWSVMKDPEAEDKIAWAFWTLSSILAIFAIEDWAPKNWIQPIGWGLVQAPVLLLTLVTWRPKKRDALPSSST